MAKKKMKAQTVAKTISSKELKFWLEGILEFQSDDWVPNSEQWKSIQDKIFNLEEIDYRPEHSPPKRTAPMMNDVIENVFLPKGGRTTDNSVETFSGPFDENNPAPSAVSSLIPTAIQGPVPVKDSKGFYVMPNEIGISENPVPASGTKVKFNPNGYV